MALPRLRSRMALLAIFKPLPPCLYGTGLFLARLRRQRSPLEARDAGHDNLNACGANGIVASGF